jgi:hypothetical protein
MIALLPDAGQRFVPWCETCGEYKFASYVPDAKAEWWPSRDPAERAQGIEENWPLASCMCAARRTPLPPDRWVAAEGIRNRLLQRGCQAAQGRRRSCPVDLTGGRFRRLCSCTAPAK